MKLLWGAAGLTFGSGFCALVYQTVWLRELRFVFGASTPANAAVLALFMGGLGLGAVLFGRRAERGPRPLLLYAKLELGVTATAAVSPWLVDVVRALYLALGGSSQLGDSGATLVRLLLSALAIGAPAVLMGGTLPAVARAVTSASDAGRRGVALVYGCNTVGAVLGVLLPTFLLFEHLGFRKTLWLACLANVVLATLAWALSKEWEQPRPSDEHTTERAPRDLRRALVTLSAFVAGFVFFLAELVWYRMSAPILGGTAYTFGLILAFALLGIGLGGLLYAVAAPRRPSLGAVAVTCALEALFIVVPYAAGDQLATLAHHLRAWGLGDFPTLVAGWSFIAAVLVMPAAVVAGYQLPLLVGVAGQADDGVARDVGDVYAANTAGAVLGSLLGGFVLLPALTAPGAWLATVVILATLAALLALAARGEGRRLAYGSVPIIILALVLSSARGPTATWRHSGIGVGLASLGMTSALDRLVQKTALNSFLLEEHEGRESSLGVSVRDGIAVFINGKSDGNTRHDAPTAIGLGMTAALLHPAPRRAFVVGLASGQTAGWLAAISTMERVDVAEIEPAMRRFAELAKDTNAGALSNPKVKVHIADGREALTTSHERYDLIASEPSNPYRAGIASLYTIEFYESAREHLNHDGYFAQWVQGYDIDAETLRVVLATMRAAFPFVSVWQIGTNDLLLLASNKAQRIDVAALERGLHSAPFKDVFGDVMGIYDVEGVLAQHLATPQFVDDLIRSEPLISSDDLPLLELRFARAMGRAHEPLAPELLAIATRLGQQRPSTAGSVDWTRVEALRRRPYDKAAMELELPRPASAANADRFWAAYFSQDLRAAAPYMSQLEVKVGDLFALGASAEVLATLPAAADEYRAAIAALDDAGAVTTAAWVRLARAIEVGDETSPPLELLEQALARLHEDPFPPSVLVLRGLDRLRRVQMSPADAAAALRLLVVPFIGHNFPVERWDVAFTLLAGLPSEAIPKECVALFDQLAPFEELRLRTRVQCFQRHAPDRVLDAQRDLDELLELLPKAIEDMILPAVPQGPPATP